MKNTDTIRQILLWTYGLELLLNPFTLMSPWSWLNIKRFIESFLFKLTHSIQRRSFPRFHYAWSWLNKIHGVHQIQHAKTSSFQRFFSSNDPQAWIRLTVVNRIQHTHCTDPHPILPAKTLSPPPDCPAIEYCSHPSPWKGCRWAWQSRGWGSPRRCESCRTWRSRRWTARRACGWSGPRSAAGRWGRAAAAALLGTWTWLVHGRGSSLLDIRWQGVGSTALKSIWSG